MNKWIEVPNGRKRLEEVSRVSQGREGDRGARRKKECKGRSDEGNE